MCGRYTVHCDVEEIALEFTAKAPPEPLEKRYNAAPSQKLPVVVNNEGNRIKLFSWGLVPSWSKDPLIGNKMINARGETVAEKPSFRSAFRKRRCLVPVNGFYEWHKTSSGKRPVYITPRNASLFAFAGLWEQWQTPQKTIYSFTVITTEPNDILRDIHNRMPVILTSRDEREMWLCTAENDSEKCLDLLRPCASDEMQYHYVSRKVNSTLNDSPDLIQPVVYAEQGELF